MSTVALLVAVALAAIGVGYFVPQTMAIYGQRYFDWQETTPSHLPRYRLALLAVGMVLVSATAGVDCLMLICLTMIGVALFGVVVIDYRLQLIPDRLQILGAVGAASYLAATYHDGTALPQFIGVGVGLAVTAATWIFATLFAKVRGYEALGFGDVKLLAWLSLLFGTAIPQVLTYALLSACLVIIPTSFWRGRSFSSGFAFGPFLVFGVVLQILFHKAV